MVVVVVVVYSILGGEMEEWKAEKAFPYINSCTMILHHHLHLVVIVVAVYVYYTGWRNGTMEG
jgi:hypothetical protein